MTVVPLTLRCTMSGPARRVPSSAEVFANVWEFQFRAGWYLVEGGKREQKRKKERGNERGNEREENKNREIRVEYKKKKIKKTKEEKEENKKNKHNTSTTPAQHQHNTSTTPAPPPSTYTACCKARLTARKVPRNNIRAVRFERVPSKNNRPPPRVTVKVPWSTEISTATWWLSTSGSRSTSLT